MCRATRSRRCAIPGAGTSAPMPARWLRSTNAPNPFASTRSSLGLAAEREIALGDTARDEIARCGKVVDAERPDIHVASDREQRAGPRVAEQLLVERRRGAEIHRGDAAAERRVDLAQKRGAPRRVAGSDPRAGPRVPARSTNESRAPSPRTSAPSGSRNTSFETRRLTASSRHADGNDSPRSINSAMRADERSARQTEPRARSRGSVTIGVSSSHARARHRWSAVRRACGSARAPRARTGPAQSRRARPRHRRSRASARENRPDRRPAP